MSTFDQHRLTAAGTEALVGPGLALCQHAGLCRLALPLRASAEREWRRDTVAASIRIEAGSLIDPVAADGRRELPLPAGRLLRLLLLHIFTSALHADSAVVEIGGSINEVAAAIGSEMHAAKLREVREQLDRLLAARIVLTTDDGRELSVFDARCAKGRVDVWRSSIRLNERFFANLKLHTVALPRNVVLALRDSAPALDVCAWLAERLPDIAAGTVDFTPWSELRLQFGAISQSAAASRTAFESSLRLVAEAWPRVGFEISEDGVSLRATPGATEAQDQAAADAPTVAESVVAPKESNLAAPAVPEESAQLPLFPDVLPEPEPEPVDESFSLAEAIAAELSTELSTELSAELLTAAPPPQPAPPPAAPDVPAEPVTMQAQVGLMPHVTGLPLAVWLRRGSLREGLMIEVAPPGRYDPARCAVIAIEPIFLQISGQLQPRDLDRIAAWAAVNSDLIEGYWTGAIVSNEDARRSVRRVPVRNW